jgi:hypothetical protein
MENGRTEFFGGSGFQEQVLTLLKTHNHPPMDNNNGAWKKMGPK